MFAENHSSVPEWVFEHAARIRVFDATHNRLTELPPDRWSLFAVLSKFHIAHNQLSQIPASLCLAVRPKPYPKPGLQFCLLRCGVLTAGVGWCVRHYQTLTILNLEHNR